MCDSRFFPSPPPPPPPRLPSTQPQSWSSAEGRSSQTFERSLWWWGADSAQSVSTPAPSWVRWGGPGPIRSGKPHSLVELLRGR